MQLPERGPAPAVARAQLGPDAQIGASRHDRAGVYAAQRDGATFVTLSPVFAVPDKDSPLGLAAFGELARASRIRCSALGGIDATRAALAVRAGAHGVAVIREVWDTASPDRSTFGVAGRNRRGARSCSERAMQVFATRNETPHYGARGAARTRASSSWP